MTNLLLLAPAPPETEPKTRFGGRPLAPPGTEWPVCASCDGHMQFQGQLALDDGLLLVFMCENDPGGCDEWDADLGGNRALLVPKTGLELLEPPGSGDTLLPQSDGARLEPFEGGYMAARDAWAKRNGRPRREVLGCLGGEPAWIQGPEVPACEECEEPMSFVAQLEEGLAKKGGGVMNFGGGAAFTFVCSPCRTAKFLWQQ